MISILLSSVLLAADASPQTQSAHVGDYVVEFCAPVSATPVPSDSEPNVIQAWVANPPGVVFFIYGRCFPSNVTLQEDGLIEGFAEMAKANVTKLKDYPAGNAIFREAYVDTRFPGYSKAYTAFWWNDNVLFKVQAFYSGTNPADGLAFLHEFVSSIKIAGKNGMPPSWDRPRSKAVVSSKHDVSKILGGFGALVLIAIGVYYVVARKTAPNRSRPQGG